MLFVLIYSDTNSCMLNVEVNLDAIPAPGQVNGPTSQQFYYHCARSRLVIILRQLLQCDLYLLTFSLQNGKNAECISRCFGFVHTRIFSRLTQRAIFMESSFILGFS